MTVPRLLPHHLEDLQASGLTDETIFDARLRSITNEEATLLVGFGRSAALAFPYTHTATDGKPPFTRVKFDRPDSKGKRYAQAKGSGNRLYVPPTLDLAALKDPAVSLYLTEGEKKALKAVQEGLRCVSVSGVDSWRARVNGRSQPIADLGLIEWRGRQVFLVYDSDLATNARVRWAEYELARELTRRGAKVQAIRLPGGPNGEKVGLDDYLCGHSAESFCTLEPTAIVNPKQAPSMLATPLSQVLDTLMASIRAGPPQCVPTPFPTLNRFLAGGFAPGELIYIGAGPGVGKSALAIELARHAGKVGHRILIVSREMLNVALARRMLAQEARVRATALKTGQIGGGEWVMLETALQRLHGLPVWMTEQATSIVHIEAMAHAFPPPLDLLIVDYLQLVQAPAGIEDIRLQVQAVSVGLKRLAVALHMPVICLSSLSRQGDLKESSSLDHDGDILLFLHRDEDATETQCRLRKNRDGETGTMILRFRKEYVTFEEPSDRQES